MSSDNVLAEEIQTRLAAKKDHATSIIYNYIHTWLSRFISDSPRPLLHVILGLYHTFSKLLPEVPPEICGICKDPIHAKSLTFGSCSRGHVFRIQNYTLKFLIDRTVFNYFIDVIDTIYLYLSRLWTKDD